jgi:iduronate 2-sulfatase
MVRTSDYRYVEWRKFGTIEILARELYSFSDHTSFETINLADDPGHAGQRDALAKLLRESGVARVER